jgi:hypothetical protein
MDDMPFSETLELAGAQLPVTITRLLLSGEIARLQVKSPSGNLTLVLPLTAARDRIADRWAQVVATLAHQYPVLALRVGPPPRPPEKGDLNPNHKKVYAGDVKTNR